MQTFERSDVRLYLIDRRLERVTANGVAITYGNFCRYISGYFDTDLNDARVTADSAHNIERVRLKLFVPEGEGARPAWMTIQIKTNAQSERSAISASWR